MKYVDSIPVWGEPVDDGAVAQMLDARKHALGCALMADHHLGYGVPIGGVVAYVERISPTGVGYDIACGNKAVRLDATAKDVVPKIHRIMDEIAKTISFGVGRANQEDVDHALFDDPAWTLPEMAGLKQKARDQLGTVGGGNHYVDVFIDELDRVWVGVHFGSRGLGHGICTFYLDVAAGKGKAEDGIALLDMASPAGADYVECMRVAGDYAYAGRDWVCARVAKIIGAKVVEEVHNHHNFAWKEVHDGLELWVVRKGATPAFPGQRGFVGGSMGENSVILEGVDSEDSRTAFYSTVHGAGRRMGRKAALGKPKQGIPGRVSPEMMRDWMRKAGVVLRGGEVDESPHVYKRLPEVLAHHEGTVRVLHTLRPVGVAMAGPGVFDPYKD